MESKDSLPEWVLQLIAFSAIGMLVYLEKIEHLIQPLDDYVYGALFVMGFFGKKGIFIILQRLSVTVQDSTEILNTKKEDENKNKTKKTVTGNKKQNK
jgi:hypothetical protein